MSDDDPLVIVGGQQPLVPGSTGYVCEICGGRVWLAPSTLALYFETMPRAPIWCVPCLSIYLESQR